MKLFKKLNVGEDVSEDETGDDEPITKSHKKKREKKKEKKREEKTTEVGEAIPNLKDLYNVISQSLLLAQATNIRLGLSSIPLPPGESPSIDDTLLKNDEDKKANDDEMAGLAT